MEVIVDKMLCKYRFPNQAPDELQQFYTDLNLLLFNIKQTKHHILSDSDIPQVLVHR